MVEYFGNINQYASIFFFSFLYVWYIFLLFPNSP